MFNYGMLMHNYGSPPITTSCKASYFLLTLLILIIFPFYHLSFSFISFLHYLTEVVSPPIITSWKSSYFLFTLPLLIFPFHHLSFSFIYFSYYLTYRGRLPSNLNFLHGATCKWSCM